MSRLFPPKGVEVLSITALTNAVRTTLEKNFLSVWVSGEVSNLARPNSGHLYLTLKDASCQLRSVMYRSVALRMRFDLRDGMEIVARGRLSVFHARGEYQLNIEELHPKGVGALELAFRQLKEKLSVRGYFEPRRKKPLPRYPRTLALVTSPTGAAVRDILEILAKRWPIARVMVCPVRVQGEGAAQEISYAIHRLNQIRTYKIDAMIIGRGGGSLEDLWAFNEESVANAIFASKIPVVSAVGHETDITIADLVADFRGLTPSHAVTALTPDRNEILMGLRDQRRRLDDAVLQCIAAGRQRLDAFARRPALRRPLERIREHKRRLDELGERLRRAARRTQQRAAERLAGIAGRLESLSPLNVLSRGYSLTRTEHASALLRDATAVRVGDRLVTTLTRGEVVSRVEEVLPEPAIIPGPTSP